MVPPPFQPSFLVAMIPNDLTYHLQERIEKLEAQYKNDNDDYLFLLKSPLSDRIYYKVLICKKSVKFSKFDGSQDLKIHVRKL